MHACTYVSIQKASARNPVGASHQTYLICMSNLYSLQAASPCDIIKVQRDVAVIQTVVSDCHLNHAWWLALNLQASAVNIAAPTILKTDSMLLVFWVAESASIAPSRAAAAAAQSSSIKNRHGMRTMLMWNVYPSVGNLNIGCDGQNLMQCRIKCNIILLAVAAPPHHADCQTCPT